MRPIAGGQLEPWTEPPTWMQAVLNLLPSWLADKFYPSTNPYTPEAMAGVVYTINAIMPAFAPVTLAYLEWFNDNYASWNGYTPDDTVPAIIPATPDPPSGVSVCDAMWVDIIYAGNQAALTKTNTDLILNRLPGGTTPPIVASSTDTSRILAAVYYVAWLLWNNRIPIEYTPITDAIAAAHVTTDGKIDALDLTVDGFATNTQNAFDSLAAEVGNVDTAVDDVLAAVQALPTTGGGPGGWPGLSEATLSTPVSWTGPLDHVEAMDGCIVHISTEPSGTGKQEVGTHTSWQHAGWLAFISDNGDADELQWLNLGDAVYVPKRMSAVAGVILFPRLGSSGTLTPWTRNA